MEGERIFLLLVAYLSGENQSILNNTTLIRLASNLQGVTTALQWNKIQAAGEAGTYSYDYTRYIDITAYIGEVIFMEFEFSTGVGAAVPMQNPTYTEASAIMQINCGLFLESRSLTVQNFTGDVFNNEDAAGIAVTVANPQRNGGCDAAWNLTGIPDNALYSLRFIVAFEPADPGDGAVITYSINGIVYEFFFITAFSNQSFRTALQPVNLTSTTSIGITAMGNNTDATLRLIPNGIDFYLPG